MATDFAVVGAGVIGSAIAYHLARDGASVTLLDAAEPATAPSASWASAGGLRSQGRHGPEQAISLQAAARWHTLEQELDADLECRFGGHLHVAETEAEEAAVEARIAADRAAALPIERVTRDDIRRIAPDLAPHLRLGAFTVGDGQASPGRTAQAFAAAAARQGARLMWHTRAEPVAQDGRLSGLRLSGNGTLVCGQVILAAGAWSIDWLAQLGQSLPLRWRGLQMLLSDRAPVRLAPTVTAVGRNLSLKQGPSGALMIGGRWFAAPCGPAPRVAPVEDHARRQWDGARAILPSLEARVLARSWAGAEAQSIDAMPFIGPVAETGVYLAAGFSNHGFQISPAIGALVAQDLLAGAQPSLDAFRPGRTSAGDWTTFLDEGIAL